MVSGIRFVLICALFQCIYWSILQENETLKATNVIHCTRSTIQFEKCLKAFVYFCLVFSLTKENNSKQRK